MLSEPCNYGCAMTTPNARHGGTMTTETLLQAKTREYNRAYYLRNKEKAKQCSRDWYRDNREHHAELGKKWRADNKERRAATGAKRYLANRDRLLELNKIWIASHPENVARSNKKHQANRRGMGFQPLNEWFEGSEGHHVNNDQVIYMPGDVHQGVRHNLKTGEGMAEINALAFQYLFKHI